MWIKSGIFKTFQSAISKSDAEFYLCHRIILFGKRQNGSKLADNIFKHILQWVMYLY